MGKKNHPPKASGVRPLQGSSPAKAQAPQAPPAAEPARSPAPQQNSRSLDQKRAAFALACVNAVKGEACKSEYRAYVRRLPAIIITNGLGQAIAMELAGSSKTKEVGAGHGVLLDHISEWLEKGWEHSPYKNSAAGYRTDRLIKAIIGNPQVNLVRAQAEAMAFLKWLKKFGEALIEAKDADETAGGG